MEDEIENEGSKPIIIDNGSFNIKAGLGEEEKPKIVLRNIIVEKIDGEEIFIGEEALHKRDMLCRGLHVMHW